MASEHCTNDSCNNGYFSDPNKRLQCYVCQEALDHTGRQRPDWFAESDEECYDLKDDGYLQDCPESVDHCVTSVNVDWYIGGEQMMQFKRSCGLPDTSSTDLSCNEGFNPPIAFKGKFSSTIPMKQPIIQTAKPAALMMGAIMGTILKMHS